MFAIFYPPRLGRGSKDQGLNGPVRDLQNRLRTARPLRFTAAHSAAFFV
jgi:hypothetical protein